MNERANFVSEEVIDFWRKYDEEILASLLAKDAELESVENKLRPQLAAIKDEREKTAYLISLLKEEESTEITEVPIFSGERVNGHVKLKGDAVDEEVVCGNATLSDLMGCPSQRRAMYVIAEKNGGIVELNDAAKLVIAAGMSKSNWRTVSASLHNYLSHNDDFQWTSPSRFRLKSAEEVELTTGEEMVLEAQKNKKESESPTVSKVSKDAV